MSNATPSFFYKTLAQFLAVLHILCILFLVLGCLLPSSYLLSHIVAVPLVILQWQLNKGQCYLTQWQWRLQGRDIHADDGGQFIKSLFLNVGLDFSDRQLALIIYGIMLSSGLISVIRLSGLF